jgi:hypothetical protein
MIAGAPQEDKIPLLEDAIEAIGYLPLRDRGDGISAAAQSLRSSGLPADDKRDLFNYLSSRIMLLPREEMRARAAEQFEGAIAP